MISKCIACLSTSSNNVSTALSLNPLFVELIKPLERIPQTLQVLLHFLCPPLLWQNFGLLAEFSSALALCSPSEGGFRFSACRPGSKQSVSQFQVLFNVRANTFQNQVSKFKAGTKGCFPFSKPSCPFSPQTASMLFHRRPSPWLSRQRLQG